MSISAYNSFFFVLSANKGLVLSNLGRLKLIFAQAVRRRKRQEFGEEERGYFNQVSRHKYLVQLFIIFNLI